MLQPKIGPLVLDFQAHLHPLCKSLVAQLPLSIKCSYTIDLDSVKAIRPYLNLGILLVDWGSGVLAKQLSDVCIDLLAAELRISCFLQGILDFIRKANS